MAQGDPGGMGDAERLGGWVMPNGNYSSQRCSGLSLINKDNVKTCAHFGRSPREYCAAMRAARLS